MKVYLRKVNGRWQAFVYVLSQKRTIGECDDRGVLVYWLHRLGYQVK